MERFDALIEGYLAYKNDVNKLAPGTLRDIRCSLRRVIRQAQQLRPDTPLWKLTLAHYTRTPEELRTRAADLFAWIAEGRIKVRVGATYPLAAAADAQRALEGRTTTGKVLLVP